MLINRNLVLQSSLIVLTLCAAVQAQQCFTFDGQPLDSSPSGTYRPCSSPGVQSICCATNRANRPGGNSNQGMTQDECLPNGLCQNRMLTNGVEDTTFWSNHCTSSNFTSPECLIVCPRNRQSNGIIQMTPCSGQADSETWCCGDSNSCCATGIDRITLPRAFTGNFTVEKGVALASSRVVSSSPTSADGNGWMGAGGLISATSSSSAAADKKDEERRKSESLSTGAIAGIVIGVLALLTVLGGVMILAVRSHRHGGMVGNDAQKLASSSTSPTPSQQEGVYYRESGGNVIEELGRQGEKYELAIGQARLVELQHHPMELSAAPRVPDVTVTTPLGTRGNYY